MMEIIQKRPGLFRFAAFVAVVGLIMVINPMLRAKPVTNSDNFQFNDWMRYFMRQPGYTVEYLEFETFEESCDVIVKVPSVNSLADHITLFSLGADYEDAYMGAVRTQRSGVINEALKVRNAGDYPVTVYYDDDKLYIFYVGIGLDRDLSYGYYSEIQVE